MLSKILGLSVVAIKGFRTDMRKKQNFEARYILFSDKATYIELEEQDYYSYHDCSDSARHIEVRRDSERWVMIMGDDATYPDADID